MRDQSSQLFVCVIVAILVFDVCFFCMAPCGWL